MQILGFLIVIIKELESSLTSFKLGPSRFNSGWSNNSRPLDKSVGSSPAGVLG